MKHFYLLGLVASLCFASVDVNTAGVKELTTLKGIGEKKAKAIVAYRKSHGCFKNVDALKSVKGIGTKIISANKKDLRASSCSKKKK